MHDYLHVDVPPHTLQVTKEECDAMKQYVERIKTTRPRNPTADREPGVLVANEILDLCGESYKAADEKRAKSSRKLFDDTGIMALVCRHDRVLYWVNMTEAGERQYYMLTLLDKLFKELPQNLTVGFLYDIACQLHRSISKVRVCCLHTLSEIIDHLAASSGTFSHSGLVASSGVSLPCTHLGTSTLARSYIILTSLKPLGVMMGKALSEYGA
jgi:hypothetical protein